MQQVIDAVRQRLPQYVEAACQRVEASGNKVYASWTPALLRTSVGRVFDAVADDLAQGGVPRRVPALMARIGAQRLQDGARISDILAGMEHGFEVVSDDMEESFRDQPAAWAFWERVRARLSFAGAMALADTYMTAREAVVRAQAEEIFRLSAPLLPVYPGILLLPLVGMLDAERASQVTMAVLTAISAQASRVVLIDVTGLPQLDAAVAKRLLAAGQAARLLGTVPVLVGLSPAVAKTVVDSGLELSQLQIRGDLGDGLKYALGLLGKTIVSTQPPK